MARYVSVESGGVMPASAQPDDLFVKADAPPGSKIHVFQSGRWVPIRVFSQDPPDAADIRPGECYAYFTPTDAGPSLTFIGKTDLGNLVETSFNLTPAG